jgi:ribosome-associated translation inhibitor RaiA
MKLSLHFKKKADREPVEREVSHGLAKLVKRLKTYAPDLVQVHGCLDKHARKPEYLFSLNLSLPTGTLHSTGIGADARASVKKAFLELAAQIKKHQARLRKDYEWKRGRLRKPVAAEL